MMASAESPGIIRMPKKIAVATAQRTKIPPTSLPSSQRAAPLMRGRRLSASEAMVMGNRRGAYLASQVSKNTGEATAVVAPTFNSSEE